MPAWNATVRLSGGVGDQNGSDQSECEILKDRVKSTCTIVDTPCGSVWVYAPLARSRIEIRQARRDILHRYTCVC